MKNLEISVEQCRENDRIKELISKSRLPVKHIKILLRLSDTIYINAINYNVFVDGSTVNILLISSKPENQMGVFNSISLANVIYKIRNIENDNNDISTKVKVEDNLINILIRVKTE
jgi:hypothetical protein